MDRMKYEIINGFEIASLESDYITHNFNGAMDWLKDNLVYRKTINPDITAFSLKWLITLYFRVHRKDIKDPYVSGHDIKHCMAMLGIKGRRIEDTVAYCYPVSGKWYKKLTKELEEAVK